MKLNTFDRYPGQFEEHNHFCVGMPMCEMIDCADCMFGSRNKDEFHKWNRTKYVTAAKAGDSPVPEEIPGGSTGLKIIKVCDDLKELLLAKNKEYGDSVTKPLRVFGSSTALEGLCTRIDDKINRIYQGEEYPGDDTVDDLIGYLILYKIVKDQEESTND